MLEDTTISCNCNIGEGVLMKTWYLQLQSVIFLCKKTRLLTDISLYEQPTIMLQSAEQFYTCLRIWF
jgi:hypothetical protein